MNQVRAGDLAIVADTKEVVQIRQVFPETNQLLAFSILEQKLVLVSLDTVLNRIDAEEAGAFIEDVLVISNDGQRGEPGKRIRVDNDRQIVSVRLKDGTVIEAPSAQITVDGSQMLTSTIIVYMLQTNVFGWDELQILGKLAQLNKAYRQVVNSDRVWQYMLLKDYRAFYLHYISAETRDIHDIVKNALDAYTREQYKRGKNYHKRFYEFLKKLQSAQPLTTLESGRKFPGILKNVGITKYVNAIFQSGQSVYVLFGKTQELNKGNYLAQFRHSDDIFALLNQATAPLANAGKRIHHSPKETIELYTYDQDGHIRCIKGYSTVVVYYFSEAQQQNITIWSGDFDFANSTFLVHMTKSAIALVFYKKDNRIFRSLIYSRRDGSQIADLLDTLILRQASQDAFSAANLKDTYMHPDTRNISEWEPNSYYRAYEGVYYNNDMYVSLVNHPSEDSFNFEEWQRVEQDTKRILEISERLVQGGWHVPWREITTTFDTISISPPNLENWLTLSTFYPNFNERWFEIIVKDTSYGYSREPGWDNQISAEKEVLTSPLYNQNTLKGGLPGYTNALVSINGRVPVGVLKGASHPIFDSNGILHGYKESQRGGPFLTKIVVDPRDTERYTNLVSCSMCQESASFKCSACKETLCGKACLTKHAKECAS